jgi:hypothetical protein
VEKFRHLRMKVTNQNLICGENEGKLNVGNGCYHSVENMLSSGLLSKNVKIKVYKTVVLPLVLCGCETSLTLRKSHGLQVFENRVLRRIFGL